MLTELLPPGAAPTVLAPQRLLRDDLDGREALAVYRQAGGYAEASWARTPAELIELVEESGLRGRGGAAYPAGAKWRAAEYGWPSPRLRTTCDQGRPSAALAPPSRRFLTRHPPEISLSLL